MERRSGPRLPVSLEVSFDDGEEVLSSYLFDLGEGGIFIGTPDPLEENTILRLSLRLPGPGPPLVIAGTVIWRRGKHDATRPGMGVRFDKMRTEDRERLDAFLMKQLTSQ